MPKIATNKSSCSFIISLETSRANDKLLSSKLEQLNYSALSSSASMNLNELQVFLHGMELRSSLG